MIIRVYYSFQGNHVHCRVFTGKNASSTFAKAGDLCFSVEEWEGVKQRLFSCQFIEE